MSTLAPHSSIMIIAGELSGDQRGAEVAAVLLAKQPHLTLTGIGGDNMRAAGVTTVHDIHELAVMGFIEPIKHLPRIIKIFRHLKFLLKTERPELLILVDYPGFNLRVAKVAKKMGIKVLFYVSPQVWAWRQGRVKKIVQVVDHMAVLFPFEVAYYQAYSLPVTYVGHPLTQTIKACPSTALARQQLNITSTQRIITLLPGSRMSEVQQLLPVMLAAAKQLTTHKPDLQFLLAIAPTIARDYVQQQVGEMNNILLCDDSLLALSAANAVMVASGTATLETALLLKPMVIVYKVNALTGMIIRMLIKIPYVSLCNIVAGDHIVRELLQEQATAENIVTEMNMILDDANYRNQMIANLEQVKTKLGDMQASDRVANIALSMLETASRA